MPADTVPDHLDRTNGLYAAAATIAAVALLIVCVNIGILLYYFYPFAAQKISE